MVDIPLFSNGDQNDRLLAAKQRLASSMMNSSIAPNQADSATPLGAYGTALAGAMKNIAGSQLYDQMAKQRQDLAMQNNPMMQYLKLAQIQADPAAQAAAQQAAQLGPLATP